MNLTKVIQILILVSALVIPVTAFAQCPTGVTETSFLIQISPPGQSSFWVEIEICYWYNYNVEQIGAENWEFQVHPWYVNYYKVRNVIDLRDNSDHDDFPSDVKQIIDNGFESAFPCLTADVSRSASSSAKYNCFAYALGSTGAFVSSIYPWTALVWSSQPYIQHADKATHNSGFMSWAHASASLVPVEKQIFGGTWTYYYPKGKFGNGGVYTASVTCTESVYGESTSYWNED